MSTNTSNELIMDAAHKNMLYYYQLAIKTPCPQQRMYYESLLIKEAELFLLYAARDKQPTVKPEQFTLEGKNYHTAALGRQAKVFTLEELAQYNGANGKPAYVAVNGIVYDLSLEPTWGGGTHFGLYAGKALTVQFNGCHGNPAILRKLPQVGILQE